MRSRKLLLKIGLVVAMVVLANHGRLGAAEKGYFKGVDLFYGDTDGKNLYMEGTALEYYQGETHLRFGKAAIREREDGSREIIFEGEVLLTQEDFKVTGDRFHYNTGTEDGIFTGKVVLERAETRDEAGQVVKEGLTLVCGRLYLQTAEKAFTASEQPTIEHRDFRGSGQTISYRDAEEKLTISGGFHLWSKEDEFIGEEICFDLRQKTFEARRGAAPLELRLKIDEKEQKGEEQAKEEQVGEEQPEEGQTGVKQPGEEHPEEEQLRKEQTGEEQPAEEEPGEAPAAEEQPAGRLG
ncbi:MAG: hypothetical protein GX081_00310 [Firmicutes bacterium]|nr:hypothetical protein [Bacillota bacterium]